MTTLAAMVDDVASHLRSFTRDQELSTHLTQDVTDDATTLHVASAQIVSRGRIEVGSELIWVDSSDRSTNTLSIPPYGRGMDSTTKAAHTAGSRVIIAPLYPRKYIIDTINQQVKIAGAQLYGIENLTLEPDPTSFLYELPVYTRDVLTVKVSDQRATIYGGDVVYLRDWQFDKHAPANIATTGKGVYIYDTRLADPLEITVTISRDPAPLVAEDDEFTDTFLPESAWDVITLGAAARLTAQAESYDLATRSVEANTLDSKIDPMTAQNQSKYLYALYQQRLAEERLRLLNTHANRAHYTR
jgi:hypothetical protein